MEVALAILVGAFFAASFYLMLSRTLIRILLGVAVLGNAVNMTIFTAGRIMREVPPLIPPGAVVPEVATANPLPQALILTAIVIGFAMFSYLLVLTYRAYQDVGSDRSDDMRAAEPVERRHPSLGY